MARSQLLRWGRLVLPVGGLLDQEGWERRHGALLALLWAHVAALPLYAMARGQAVAHVAGEVGLLALAAGAGLALRRHRVLGETAVALGLLTASALAVHFSGGAVEAHFHFFVVVGALTLYQDRLPFLLAIAYVLVHHGVLGVVAPESVYAGGSMGNVWVWAGVHAAFIFAASATHLAAWRMNELDQAASRAQIGSLNRRSEFILTSAAEGIIAVDVGRVVVANPAAGEIFGLAPDGMVGSSLHELLHGDPRHACELGTLLQGGAPWSLDERVTRADGAVRDLRISGRPFADEEIGQGVVVTLQDVTERRAAEERFRLAFENAPVGMGLMDAHGRWLRVNSALCRLTRRPERALLALNLPALLHEDEELVAERLAAFLSGQTREYRDEIRLRDGAGEIVWATLGAARIDTGDAPGAYAIVQLEDVTERRHAEAMLAARALHDPLTGMGNRVLLMERLRQALSDDDRRVAVLFIDLDRFKTVNDTHGHEVGDRVLVEIAHRIQSNLRSGDTAARLGGDEFIVLCTDVRSSADVTELVERLQARIREPIGANGQYVSVSVSVGVVVPQESGATADALLRQADLAMYRAKQLGRSRMAMFDEDLEQHLERRLRLEHGLHEAFRSRQFEVWYQPLIDLSEGVVCGAEALVRWRHPERGVLPPAAFLQVAEETGLVVPLSDWVLEHAAEQAAAWLARFGPLDLAVNVSARQLDRPDWPNAVAAILERSGLPAGNLHLELTETALFEAGSGTIGAFRGLRAQGVHIGIDDFGTGYSSMSYLRDFPVDFLKVDRAFVSELDSRSRESTAIVEAILALGRALGLRTVGEGVETPAQAERLAELGCDLAQGFLLGKPMPAAEFEALLEARPRLLAPRVVRSLRAVGQTAG